MPCDQVHRVGDPDNDHSLPSLYLQPFVLRQALPRRQSLLTHILSCSIFPLHPHGPGRRLIGSAWSRAHSAWGEVRGSGKYQVAGNKQSPRGEK